MSFERGISRKGEDEYFCATPTPEEAQAAILEARELSENQEVEMLLEIFTAHYLERRYNDYRTKLDPKFSIGAYLKAVQVFSERFPDSTISMDMGWSSPTILAFPRRR